MVENQTGTIANTTQNLVSDIERMLGQRLGQLREEVVDEFGKATTAGVSLGSGLGMTALGTMLGGLAFVHLVHETTKLPLWLCYAASSAAACGVGAALIAQGRRKAGDIDFLPEGAGRAARDVAKRAVQHAAT